MINDLIYNTTAFFTGDPKRIQHFMKVYAYASVIGQESNMTEQELFILEAAAIVHDTGIKISEEIYGYNNGKLQEKFGPEAATPLLKKAGFNKTDIEKICFLVSNHHTYTKIDTMIHQILIEADLLVNLYEDEASKKSIQSVYNKYFKTSAGKRLCQQMFKL